MKLLAEIVLSVLIVSAMTFMGSRGGAWIHGRINAKVRADERTAHALERIAAVAERR